MAPVVDDSDNQRKNRDSKRRGIEALTIQKMNVPDKSASGSLGIPQG